MNYNEVVLVIVVGLFAVEKVINIYQQHKLINKIMSGSYQAYVQIEKPAAPVVQAQDYGSDPFTNAYIGGQ